MHKRASAITVAAGFATIATFNAPAGAAIVENPWVNSAEDAALSLVPVGTYETGQFAESAAEIVTYHAGTKRILTVNAQSGKIDVLDASDPASLTKVDEISGGENTTINSVAVRADGLAAATVEPSVKTDSGSVIFFNVETLETLGSVTVGALPDMITMTEDGAYALVANEGEPAEDYSVDPEGSISVIPLPESIGAATEVLTASFSHFNEQNLPDGVRIFGTVGASDSVAQNIEPEYIATHADKAYISLQENNAIAVMDIATATVEKILPLGTVDLNEVKMDISDKDGIYNPVNAPIKSFLLPDALDTYTVGETTYIVTANEGDGRDWEGYSEETRIKDLVTPEETGAPRLCEDFAGMTTDQIAAFTADEGAGRLKITTSAGLNEEGTCFEELYTFGGRGFSIFTTDGERVYNSDDDFERIINETHPKFFNSDHEESAFDSRSSAKGPEPEAVVVGEIDGRHYAFIANERVGGILVYDVTDPASVKFVTYVNNRDFTQDMAQGGDLAKAGDLGPEGLAFVPASSSPNGKNLLVAGNEVSGTTTVFQIDSLISASPAPSSGSSGSTEAGSSTAGVVARVIAALTALIAVLAPAVASKNVNALIARVRSVLRR